jgi:hypothetical protein
MAGRVSLLDYFGYNDRPRKGKVKETNDYLKTRTDLLPKCLWCEKQSEEMWFYSKNTLRIACHGRVADLYIADDIVKNQDRLFEWLKDLPNKEVFTKKPIPYAGQADMRTVTMPMSFYPTTGYTVSRASDFLDYMGAMPVEAPAKKKTEKKKVYAPLLEIEPQKRAITFDD